MDLEWVVGHEPRAPDAQVAQDRGSHVVTARIVGKAQNTVRVDRVDPVALERVRAHLVPQADAPTFLPQVYDHTTPGVGDRAHGLIELVTAIALERTHHLARPAL